MQTQSEETERPTYLSTEQLYRAHRPFVARFLTRLGVRPEALDDAVQEVFVTVHRRGGYVLGPAKPTSYLATIAVNTAAAQRRTARKASARRGELEPEELVAGGCDPGEVLETRQELRRLDRALGKLDPTLRDTLLAADGEGETCVAIADATSVPVGTVYWRLDRARKKFREALRVVDAHGRRRVGMMAVFLTDWRWLRKVTAPKVALGLSVGALMASLTLFAARKEQVATPTVVEPVTRTVALATPEVIAPPEPPAEVVEVEEVRPRRVHTRARRVRTEEPTLTNVSLVSTPIVTRTVTPTPTPSTPAREPEVSETMQLARAEAALAHHPREALALVRAIDGRESANYLREERDYIELMALLALGERAGQERAASFLRHYPGSAFARTVRAKSGLP